MTIISWQEVPTKELGISPQTLKIWMDYFQEKDILSQSLHTPLMPLLPISRGVLYGKIEAE